MPKIENNRVLPYQLSTLYDVIVDVEKYSDFIPWCESVKIASKTDEEIISDVRVKFLFIKESYRSVAKFIPPDTESVTAQTTIEMLSGPFEYFSTIWKLKAISKNKTYVNFKCDFKFKNPIYNSIAGTFVMGANDKIMNAFIKRAALVSNTL